jgi:hypothetical protein
MYNNSDNGVNGLANRNNGFINISIEPLDEKEIARLKKEQELQHFTNILKYLRYKSASVKDTGMGVIIESINTEGKDWFYYVADINKKDEDGDPEMITYWCYDDEISGEVDEPEVCARGMMEYMDEYFAASIA